MSQILTSLKQLFKGGSIPTILATGAVLSLIAWALVSPPSTAIAGDTCLEQCDKDLAKCTAGCVGEPPGFQKVCIQYCYNLKVACYRKCGQQ